MWGINHPGQGTGSPGSLGHSPLSARHPASKFASIQEAITPTYYIDSDHNKSGDCRSRSGQVIFMSGAPIFALLPTVSDKLKYASVNAPFSSPLSGPMLGSAFI